VSPVTKSFVVNPYDGDPYDTTLHDLLVDQRPVCAWTFLPLLVARRVSCISLDYSLTILALFDGDGILELMTISGTPQMPLSVQTIA